ncbi:MAG: hypothetical protein CK427_06145 [Leptospira sp.]|nr:MAG: hypothetical protein CK427_06145 [Leptospira sp.]
MNEGHTFEHDTFTFEYWKDFRNYIFTELDDPLKRFGEVYRGHSNENWPLQPSIHRIRANDDIKFINSMAFIQELNDIKELKQSIHLFNKDFINFDHSSSNIDLLSLLQHHGAATRLLDFTASPFIASFFALTDPNKKDDYCCVWSISLKIIDEINKKLLEIIDPNPFQILYDLYCKDILDEHKTKDIIGYSFLERPSIRPFQQKSGFLFSLSRDNNIEKLIPQYNSFNSKLLTKYKIRVNKENIQSAFRDFTKMNISFANLFPGFDGYCKDILMRQYAEWY